jgi:hypothetical protein
MDLVRISSPKKEIRNHTPKKFNYHIQLPVMPTFKVIPESFRPHREPVTLVEEDLTRK